jgi:hypothetical protein
MKKLVSREYICAQVPSSTLIHCAARAAGSAPQFDPKLFYVIESHVEIATRVHRRNAVGVQRLKNELRERTSASA